MRGIPIFVLVLAVVGPSAAPAAAPPLDPYPPPSDKSSGSVDHSGYCTGFAPFDNNCTSGAHYGGWTLIHGPILPPCPDPAGRFTHKTCFVGTIVSSVKSIETGEGQEIVCSVIALTEQPYSLPPSSSCVTLGGAPGFDPVAHECHAYSYGDAALMLQPRLAPGLGAWGCFIYH